MIEPADILAVADHLSERELEAFWRLAVSRAYYSAYLHCRDVLLDRGFRTSGGAQDHAAVAQAAGRLNRQASRRLRDLRVARNRADYEISVEFHQKQAFDACASARAV